MPRDRQAGRQAGRQAAVGACHAKGTIQEPFRANLFQDDVVLKWGISSIVGIPIG